MMKKRQLLTIMVMSVPLLSLFGAAGRPKDGILSLLILLGFLGAILGVILMVDYIRFLAGRFSDIRRFMTKEEEET